MQQSNERQLAPVEQKTKTVRHLLAISKEQIEMALPKHVPADRLIRVAMTSIQRTPKLLDCDPKSLIAAIMQSAQLGLMPDGVLGEAYLIPFKDQVQFIIGYRGLISLARRSGEIVSLAAHCVHKNDTFEFEYGLDEKLRHVPNMFGDRGELVATYAVAKLKDGGYAIEVMSRKDIEAIRDRSQGYKSAIKFKKDHPWITDFDQMARKTVLRRLSKYLPVSVEMLEAIAVDEQTEAGKMITTVDNGSDLAITKATAEDLTTRFINNGHDMIDGKTGEVIDQDNPTPHAPKQPSDHDQEQEQNPEQPADNQQLSPLVKKFMKEINQASTGGSIAVDQWRAHHNKRVERECGGVDTPDYRDVMDYAEIVYREVVESEKEQSQNGGENNGNLF